MDYARHRLQLMLRLVGRHHHADLVDMVDSPHFAPEAGRTAWQERWHSGLRGGIETLKAWGAASVWPALFLALFWLLAVRRRPEPIAPLPACLVLSALLYAGSLVLVAPSAELRYLAWPLWAALVAMALPVGKGGH